VTIERSYTDILAGYAAIQWLLITVIRDAWERVHCLHGLSKGCKRGQDVIFITAQGPSLLKKFGGKNLYCLRFD